MRRFELIDGKSRKFWAIRRERSRLVVSWGRIDTKGQTKTFVLESPVLARKEETRRVADKLRKGYAEVGAVAAAQSRASVGRFSFSAEVDELFVRGYPHLFVLNDGEDPSADAVLARAALDDVDPVLPVHVSRGAASRFLRGYAVGKTWKATRKGFVAIKKRVIARDRELSRDGPVDETVLSAILDAQCPHGDETYGWRVQQAVFLCEAFLGTETVASVLSERLVRASEDLKPWGFWGEDPHRANTHACALAEALGFMRLRMSTRRWRRLVRPLSSVDNPALISYSDLLRCVADDTRVSAIDYFTVPLALQRGDRRLLRKLFAERRQYWLSPRFFYIAGADLLDSSVMKHLPRLPRWWQRRIVSEYGQIRHRATVRIIAWILSGRAARKEAGQWLIAHAPYARKPLARMARIKGEAGLARAARAVIERGAEPAPVAVTEEALQVEIRELFGALEAQLTAARGSRQRERRVLEEAFARYCDVRAAVGDCSPGAYFTHHLPAFTAKPSTIERWCELAEEVALGG